MGILTERNFYKPHDYPWAFTAWKQHEAMHWMGYEVPLSEDVRDWSTKLTQDEKNLITNLFRFFTQADVDVAGGYSKHFIPYFCHKPELAMMMCSFAAREAVHIDAYALLLETLGMDEGEYRTFHEYKEMKAKHDYVESFKFDTPMDVAKSLAVYSAFTEGMQLFASFVILLNFTRHNKMKNMGNIVAWSIRDESAHVDGMTKLFRTYIQEMEDHIDLPTLAKEVQEIRDTMIMLEDHFIDLCFNAANNNIEGLTKDEVKHYIRFISDGRVTQLGLEELIPPIVVDGKNPLPWVEYLVNGEEHANFFESKSTFYSKAMTEGTMEDIQW